MRQATTYLRGKAILVHASSRTTEGVWILAEPCIRLSSDCTNVALGEAVQAALQGSENGIPHPTNWKGIIDPLLQLAGVKTWKTFAKSASCVEVEEKQQNLLLIPTKNLGAVEGFQADETSKVNIPLPSSSETIGASLRQAFLLAH